jgi:amidohydrolase
LDRQAGGGTSDWQALTDAAVALRRRLHRHPELAWEETTTAQLVRDELDQAGIAWRACAGTGTVATLAPHAPGRHVALRTDLDAMPIDEATGVDWSSETPGVMHACGHDGHIATLFAAAWWCKRHEDLLPGPVTLLFQPAEEGGHGAKGILDDGGLDGVDVVYGWHNWPALPVGRAVCPDGPVMSANGTFEIEVLGVGGHASQPEVTRDPVLAAAAITMALQQVVARRTAPQQPAVVSVSSIEAPSGPTVTPERALIGGSIRVPETAARDEIFALMTQIAEDTGRAYGVDAKLHPTPRYGATVNHPTEAGELRAALAGELGDRWHSAETAVPVMASEDFSYYLDALPGAFALIGTGRHDGHGATGGDDAAGDDHVTSDAAADNATDAPLHSPFYDFNDQVIGTTARVLIRLGGAPLP